jgi:dTDP-glucose pyrophosphorylase
MVTAALDPSVSECRSHRATTNEMEEESAIWGIVPCAGLGTRMRSNAFSKELLPVGTHADGDGERPKAISEYLLDRMVDAGATRICVVVSPSKFDIVRYYGATFRGASLCYVVQPDAYGLVDAVFRAMPLLRSADGVLLGLPDTVWFPVGALGELPHDGLSLLLFPVERPDAFDAVLTDASGRVTEVRVKDRAPGTSWIWGAVRGNGAVFRQLHALWSDRGRSDQYIGTLLNAYIARGGVVHAAPLGERYIDVGTPAGYRDALQLVSSPPTARVGAATLERV